MVFYGKYNPGQYGWHADPDGSHIIRYQWHGIDFPRGVAQGTTTLWDHFLAELTPHIPGGLHPGECWGYNYRQVTGGNTLSFHAYGLALDLNAPSNPYDRTPDTPAPHTIPDMAGPIAHKYLMEWGGNWNTPKDWMHFEIHGTPHDVDELSNRLLRRADQPPAPVHYEPYRHVKQGSRTILLGSAGDDVKYAQTWIGASRCGPADGYYGRQTYAGVRWYQHMRGISSDGIIGPATWHQMGVR